LKADTAINHSPSQKLDIYVFGDGESGELGLGAKPINGQRPTNVKRPRRNVLLDATKVGVVQIAAGGMHGVTLTHDQKIITWGVNDNGALGRDTTWEATTRDIDEDSNAEDSDEEGDLNPKESTPTSIPAEDFGKPCPTFVQVAATDSASFAVTSEGSVYGWGTFCVSSLINSCIASIVNDLRQTMETSVLLRRARFKLTRRRMRKRNSSENQYLSYI